MVLNGSQTIKAIFIFVIAAVTFAGCGGRLLTFEGGRVTRKDLIARLEDGNQKGVWKTNELAITYQYQTAHETMDIAGTVELAGGLKTGFNQIEHLVVYVLFLNDQGIVIKNELIYSIGNHHSTNITPLMRFESKVPVPEGSREISFAYDGELVDAGDDGMTAYGIGFSPSR